MTFIDNSAIVNENIHKVWSVRAGIVALLVSVTRTTNYFGSRSLGSTFTLWLALG